MVVGAYHPQTGVSTVGVSCHGVCAEQNAAAALNVNPSEIIFSEPVSPRLWYGGENPPEVYIRPVCTTCQSMFSQSQFPPGAPYEPGGKWVR